MKKIVAFSLIALVAIGTGCTKFDQGNQNNVAAGLMVFNLATDQSQVGMYIDGNAITNIPLGYTHYNGHYQGVFPGNRTVEATDVATGERLASAPANFETDKFYSSFFIGTKGHYQNLVIRDGIDTLSATGQAYVRIVNAVPDSSAPIVSLAPGNEFASRFGAISSFVPVEPGNLMVNVSNGTTIQAERTIPVTANKIYTLLLVGTPEATTNGVEIKYIENGLLDGEEAGRRTSSSSISSVN